MTHEDTRTDVQQGSPREANMTQEQDAAGKDFPQKFPRQANKGSLAEKVAEELSVPRRSATRILDAVLDSIRDLLRENRRVAVKGFGTFDCKKRKGRAYKHPVTGKSIEVPDKDTILFKPSDQLILDTREDAQPRPRKRQPLNASDTGDNNPLGL